MMKSPGFALVEVLLTVMILSVGLVGVISALVTNQRAAKQIEVYRQVILTAQNMIPRVLAQAVNQETEFEIKDENQCRSKFSIAPDMGVQDFGVSAINVDVTCNQGSNMKALMFSTFMLPLNAQQSSDLQG